jgi:hypothetical protein
MHRQGSLYVREELEIVQKRIRIMKVELTAQIARIVLQLEK